MIGISQIDHICIAVHDLPAAMAHWGKLLGKDKPDLEYTHDEEAIRVARYYVGEVGYELMCFTRTGSEVDHFIKKRGQGVMLISFKVPDTVATMEFSQSFLWRQFETDNRIAPVRALPG
jgi:methylmalonyl-CoA/ethylmalonyl-CoA epimerase